MTNQLRAVGLLTRDQQILLGRKQEGIGEGNYVAIGGKQDPGETIEETLVREMSEEINVQVKSFQLVAQNTFVFPNKPDWDQTVYAYLCDKWVGTPVETAEMQPLWVDIDKIPFDKMWGDARFWYPLILEGKKVKTVFTYSPNNKDLAKIEVNIVDRF